MAATSRSCVVGVVLRQNDSGSYGNSRRRLKRHAADPDRAIRISACHHVRNIRASHPHFRLLGFFRRRSLFSSSPQTKKKGFSERNSGRRIDSRRSPGQNTCLSVRRHTRPQFLQFRNTHSSPARKSAIYERQKCIKRKSAFQLCLLQGLCRCPKSLRLDASCHSARV